MPELWLELGSFLLCGIARRLIPRIGARTIRGLAGSALKLDVRDGEMSAFALATADVQTRVRAREELLRRTKFGKRIVVFACDEKLATLREAGLCDRFRRLSVQRAAQEQQRENDLQHPHHIASGLNDDGAP